MSPPHSYLRFEMPTCFCLRFPQEAIVVVIDWFDAPPRTFWNDCMFAKCPVASAYSLVAEIVRVRFQSALKRALTWRIGVRCLCWDRFRLK